MSKDQQPPKSKRKGDAQDANRRSAAQDNAGHEHFVLEPEPRKRRRWLATDPAYGPHDSEAASVVERPLGYVSEPRPSSQAPPMPRKPTPPPPSPQTPPLGFVSEPRPPRHSDDAGPRLGIISRDELGGSVGRPPPGGGVAPAAGARPEEATSTTSGPQSRTVKPAEPLLVVQAEPEPEVASSQPETGAQTPGQMLRAARQNKGLSQEDIVLQTHMSLETIQALEEDRAPPQSAWVYVRGFYRRYARALRIPEGPLLEAHERIAGHEPILQPVAEEWTPQDVSPRGRAPQMLFVMLFSVALGVLAWWLVPKVSVQLDKVAFSVPTLDGISNRASAFISRWLEPPDRQAPAPAPVARVEPATAAPVALADLPPAEQPQQAEAAAGAVTAAPEPVVEAPAPAADTVDDGVSVAIAPAPNAQAASTDSADVDVAPADMPPAAVLELEFTRQSWVSVADADGLLLFEGMVEGNESRSFSGQSPLTLFLGTATAASATFNGQAVNIAQHMRPNGTARIVLGE